MRYVPPPGWLGPSGARLRWEGRLVLVVAGLVLVALLGIARTLSPSPRGWGTHEQLGLPACAFPLRYQVRCPSCGMTTAWAHLVRGSLIAALRCHVTGTLLGLAAASGSVWMLTCGMAGRWVLGRPGETTWLLGGAVLGAALLAEWAVRVGWWG